MFPSLNEGEFHSFLSPLLEKKNKYEQELEKPVEANYFKHTVQEMSIFFITRYRKCEFTVIIFR